MFDVTVAFFIFNRPDTTERVFAEIAKVKPHRLLVIADGPRVNNPEDVEKCFAARKVIERVDWDCRVLTDYSEINLGCKRRVSSGLDWVFEQCERAIILEDDCLPHPTFFPFIAECLDRYSDDERVMMVSGNNNQFGRKRGEHSYYFSYYPHIWGWGTWSRAWRHYDVDMKQWPGLRDTEWLRNILDYQDAIPLWKKRLDLGYEGNIDTWDIQWVFTVWLNRGLSLISNTNLITNIGFRDDATHTTVDVYGVANTPAEEMVFPIKHPDEVVRDIAADQFTYDRFYAAEPIVPDDESSAGVLQRFRRRLGASLRYRLGVMTQWGEKRER